MLRVGVADRAARSVGQLRKPRRFLILGELAILLIAGVL